MQSIQRLDWDSNSFGYEVGRIEIDNPENFHYDNFFNISKKFKLVYIYTFHKIENVQLKLVDEKAIFCQTIENAKAPVRQQLPEIISSFNFEKNSIEELRELALLSGIYSRFNTDNNFKNNEYQNLYQQWINNSVNGKLAIDVIVSLIKNKIIGLLTLNKKNESTADIGLLAVNDNYRGYGIGTDLINEAIERAKNIQFKEIQVVTQLANTPAVKFTKRQVLP